MPAIEGGADLESAAQALVLEATTPRRRVRPRLAEPLQDAEDRLVETPAGQVMTWRLGAGSAVLLVHGWEDDNALWGRMLGRIVADGASAVVVDLPGHGFSPAPIQDASTLGAALGAVAAAQAPVDAVIGHSFGCIAAMHALGQGLRADRVVMIGCPPLQRASLRRIEHADAPEAARRRAAEILSAQRLQAAAQDDLPGLIRSMTASALFIHAYDDAECPIGEAQAAQALWPGSTFLAVDGLGHRRIAQDEAVAGRAVDFALGWPSVR